MKKYQTIKIWTITLSKLRILAALRGKSIVEIIDFIITEELKKEHIDESIVNKKPMG
jgi:hypothetical protein